MSFAVGPRVAGTEIPHQIGLAAKDVTYRKKPTFINIAASVIVILLCWWWWLAAMDRT